MTKALIKNSITELYGKEIDCIEGGLSLNDSAPLAIEGVIAVGIGTIGVALVKGRWPAAGVVGSLWVIGCISGFVIKGENLEKSIRSGTHYIFFGSIAAVLGLSLQGVYKKNTSSVGTQTGCS